MRISKQIIICALFALTWLTHSEAVLMNFEYTLNDGSIFSASIDGTVQSDGDTVLVTDTIDFNYLSDSIDTSDFDIYSISGGPVIEPGIISFSGAIMDLLVCDVATCTIGYLVSTSTLAGAGEFTFNSPASSGLNINSPFNPSAWNLEITAMALPEPSTALLLVIGAFGIWFGTRKSV